jgi:DNA-binding CsgD family transcriptional regulator
LGEADERPNAPARAHNVLVLVGRAHLLAQLLDAIAKREPVVVLGEAGSGKTTLLRAAAAESGRRVLEGGALATLSWMQYLPLTRALGREITGADPEAIAWEVAAAVGDGVLLVDDAQWAHPATLEVLALVAGRVACLVGLRTGVPEADEVQKRLVAGGFREAGLPALTPDEATTLVARLRPGVSAGETTALVARAGGNPLLLRELAVSGAASASLRRTVAARLRRLSPAERDAFALLALAARPLRADLVDAQALEALRRAALVTSASAAPDQVEVRHSLLGDAALEEVTEAQRRSLHRRLADLVDDPGEAAHHLHLAGESERCRLTALDAVQHANRPGEKAAMLRLAALSSVGPAADELRLAAASSLEDAHDWDGVLAVLDLVEGDDPTTVARVALMRARAGWSAGVPEVIEPALATGLDAVPEDDPLAVQLRIESCRVPIFLAADLVEGVRSGETAVALARRHGVGVARAEYFLGTALAVADQPSGADHLEAAVLLARDAGDVNTELTAANNLASYHESSGSPARAVAVAREMEARSRSLGLGGWEVNFGYQALQLDYHAGRLDGLVGAVRDLLRRTTDHRTRDALELVHVMALVDTGRGDEALVEGARAHAEAVDDYSGATQVLWALGEAALWTGDPRRALEFLEAFRAGMPPDIPITYLGAPPMAWARLELGEDPDDPIEASDRAMLFAVPHEVEGVVHAFRKRYDEAVTALRLAEELWAPYHLRGALRCAWGAGEMLRLAGRTDEAVPALLDAEKRAADAGLVPILHRAQRSLRAAGHRRSAGRTRSPSGLTGREQEVLDLVAQGLTNEQVAARLGVARRTVVAQIASAQAKLGASNRLQAATLAAALSSDERDR